MLNKHNLEIANLASAEESRYALCGIKVTPKETAVTDGHLLLRVEAPNTEGNSIPEIAGFTPKADFDEFILPRKAALEVAKNIPNSKSIPALNFAFVGAGDQYSAEIGLTDLDMPKVLKPRKQDGLFPNIDLVTPKGELRAEIQLNLDLLIPLLQQIAKAQGGNRSKTVLLSLYGKESPLRFDAINDDTHQRILGVLMPMKREVHRNYPLVDKVEDNEREETQ